MSAVSVYLNPADFFCIDIPGDMPSPLHNQARPAFFHCLMGKHRAEQPGPYNQIIIFHFRLLKSAPAPALH